MIKNKLKSEIIKHLVKKTGLATGTIRKNISLLRRDYPSCTLNAVAQLFARSRGYTVMQKLSHEDKNSLPNTEIVESKIKIYKKNARKKDKIIEIIKYSTSDYFKRGHIGELNKAYSRGCYTSVYILARKIIENLICEILLHKFPPKSRKNKELYFDIDRKRFKDFNVILSNLYDKRHDFEPDKIQIIQRLYQKAKKFKEGANDATHSWYHLVEGKQEIDDLNLQAMIELIKKLEA